MEHKLRKGWASKPLGVLEPTCLRQRGSKTATLADRPLEWPSPECLGPRPWLFGAARSQGRAPIDNLSGLGSPLWLFAYLKATQKGQANKAGTSSLRTPTTQYQLDRGCEQRITLKVR